MSSVHVLVPLQSPAKPPNCDALVVDQPIVIRAPTSKSSTQVVAFCPVASTHAEPPSTSTLPPPDPDRFIVSATCRLLNVAVAARACVSVVVHVLPLALAQAPPHPPKTDWASVVPALRVITLPYNAACAHMPLLALFARKQSIPSADVTRPAPLPASVIDNVFSSKNAAVTVRPAPDVDTAQLAAVPVQSPDQPPNT